MFEKRVVCRKCGWHGHASSFSSGYSAMSAFYGGLCPSCGKVASFFDSGKVASFSDSGKVASFFDIGYVFEIRPMKKINTVTWWKPSTWGTSRWEEVDQT